MKKRKKTIPYIKVILIVVLAISLIGCSSTKNSAKDKEAGSNQLNETRADKQTSDEIADQKSADDYQKVVMVALQDYVTADSNSFEDYQNGNLNVVTSIATEEEIPQYKTLNTIVRAGYKGETEGAGSLAALSWEYKVYQELKDRVTLDVDARPLLQPKQENKKFYIRIEGNYGTGYGVSVKCDEGYPFAAGETGNQETAQDTMQETVQGTMQETVQDTIQETVHGTIQETVQDTMQENVQETVRDTIQETVQNTTQKETTVGINTETVTSEETQDSDATIEIDISEWETEVIFEDDIYLDVQHNAGTVIQVNDKKYYWKYNAQSLDNAALRANYFYNPSTMNQLICMDASGNEETVLTTHGAGKLWVIQNQLYFHKPFDASLRSYEVYKLKYVDGTWKGETAEKVFEGEILAYSEMDNTIIYKSKTYAPYAIYAYSLETQQSKLLADMCEYFTYQDGLVYFSNSIGTDVVISTVNLQGVKQELQTIVNEEGTNLEIGTVQLIDDYLYFSYGYTDGNIHDFYYAQIARMNRNGDNYEVLSDTETGWFYVYKENGEIKLLKEFVEDKIFVDANGMAVVYTDGATTALQITNLKEHGYGEAVTLMVELRDFEIVNDKMYYTIFRNRYSDEVSMGWRDGYVRESSEMYEKDRNTGETRLIYAY